MIVAAASYRDGEKRALVEVDSLPPRSRLPARRTKSLQRRAEPPPIHIYTQYTAISWHRRPRADFLATFFSACV